MIGIMSFAGLLGLDLLGWLPGQRLGLGLWGWAGPCWAWLQSAGWLGMGWAGQAGPNWVEVHDQRGLTISTIWCQSGHSWVLLGRLGAF